MKNQVLSVEQMQELIALGVDASKASMCWFPRMLLDENKKPVVHSHFLSINNISCNPYWNTIEGRNTIPTFTLQDILTCLEKIKPILSKDELCWFMEVHNLERSSLVFCEGCDSDSPLETAFKVLKWCKQNNYI